MYRLMERLIQGTRVLDVPQSFYRITGNTRTLFDIGRGSKFTVPGNIINEVTY
eukprot:SAG11_NODE_1997_length_3945_cov_56.897556_4_plen_53_part_00